MKNTVTDVKNAFNGSSDNSQVEERISELNDKSIEIFKSTETETQKK